MIKRKLTVAIFRRIDLDWADWKIESHQQVLGPKQYFGSDPDLCYPWLEFI